MFFPVFYVGCPRALVPQNNHGHLQSQMPETSATVTLAIQQDAVPTHTSANCTQCRA